MQYEDTTEANHAPDLIGELVAMGMTRAAAARFLAECDQVTTGHPREVARRLLKRLGDAAVSVAFDGRESLVPPGYERT